MAGSSTHSKDSGNNFSTMGVGKMLLRVKGKHMAKKSMKKGVNPFAKKGAKKGKKGMNPKVLAMGKKMGVEGM